MRKLLYIWILLPLCIACERDLMSYKGEEAIYFAVQSGHSYASEKDWPYMPYTLAEFGKVQEDTMVVNIKVMITGPEKDYPGEPCASGTDLCIRRCRKNPADPRTGTAYQRRIHRKRN